MQRQTPIQPSATHARASRTRLWSTRRLFFWIALFVLLCVVAGLGSNAQQVMAVSENWTVPEPGGTVPPPPYLNKMTLIHAAPFDSDVNNLVVDICDSDGLITGLTNIGYLENRTGYLLYGPYRWTVAKAGTMCADPLFDIDPFELGAASEVILVLSGDVTNQPLAGSLIVVNSGGTVIRAPIIQHGPLAP